jgi:hypothetical protein
MIRNMSLILIILTLAEIPSLCTVPPVTLKGKEIVWSGKVELKNDIIIQEGSTLIIMPGTKINCIYDYNDQEFSPKEWKIIVKGDLVARGEADNPVTFNPMPRGLSSIRIPVDSRIEQIVIAPHKIDTEEIKKEFSAFKTQYLILWTLLFGSIYYAIVSRKD